MRVVASPIRGRTGVQSREKSRSRLVKSSHKSNTRNPQPVRSAEAWTPPLRSEVQTLHPRQGWAGASEPLLGALPVLRAHRVLPGNGWLGPRKEDIVADVS